MYNGKVSVLEATSHFWFQLWNVNILQVITPILTRSKKKSNQLKIHNFAWT